MPIDFENALNAEQLAAVQAPDDASIKGYGTERFPVINEVAADYSVAGGGPEANKVQHFRVDSGLQLLQRLFYVVAVCL